MEENQTTEEIIEEPLQAPVYSQVSIDYIEKVVKKARKKGIVQGLLTALVLIVISALIYTGVTVGIMVKKGTLYSKVFGATGNSVLDKESLDKIDTLYNMIENSYLEDVDKQTIQDGIYKGILESLDDPYSVYYTKEEFDEMMSDSSGTFEGIGAYLSQDPDTKDIVIVKPIKDSPAEKAGMLTDDVIVEVNGEDVEGQDLNLVVSKLRGPKGTEVTVGVRRSGADDLLYFTVKRDQINSISVDYEMLDDKIGYIAIGEFEDATADQFREAFSDLEGQGMTSLIIDLRSNGGGYVDSAVEIADRLVKDGVIVSVKDKHGLSYKYEDAGDENYLKVPCVLLVDGNTASSSEILTGALRDHKLATIIGTKTFGKGITQIIAPLDDGSGVKITNSKYYTPNGENIHEIGIEPDIEVEWDPEAYKKDGTDVQLEAAKKYLKDKQK